MDLLGEVINHIIYNGLAVAKDSDIFKDYAPSTPDNCVIVYEYNGSSVAVIDPLSVRSVQIVVRNKSIQAAKALIWQIFKILSPENGIMRIGTRTCIVSNRNTPIKIGVDEQARNMCAFNIGITTTFD